MRMITLPQSLFLSVTLVLTLPSLADAQASPNNREVPRTADGRPDLSGVWANNSATPLERPDELADKATFTPEELATMREAAQRLFGGADDAAFGDGVFQAVLDNVERNVSRDGGTGNYSSVWMVDRVFENRTSLITDPPDGKLPPLTRQAERQQADQAEQRQLRPYDGPEDLPLQVRCLTYGIPRIGGIGAGYNSYYQIFQTPGHIVMLGEMIHDARVIPISDAPHVSNSIRQWHGDARGHWEEDTLVVETTNFDPRALYRNSGAGRRLVERLTRMGPDTLHYEVTVTDPATWTRPWTALVPLSQTDDAVYEYACHEGNIGMYGILAGARVQEANPTEQP